MKSSKSAHVITSCEVYAEVADAAEGLYSLDGSATSQKRQSYHSGGATMGGNIPGSNTSRFKYVTEKNTFQFEKCNIKHISFKLMHIFHISCLIFTESH